MKICLQRLGSLESSRTLTIATFLDPRFKNVGFSNESVANYTKKLVINLVANKIQPKLTNFTQYTHTQAPSNNEISYSEQEQAGKKILSVWSHFDKTASTFQPTGTASSRAIVEVQRFLEGGLLERE